MNNKKKKKQNGFTIVELVIVIAVIGILAAVLIPTFSNLVKKAKQSADQQLVYHINEAVVANETDNIAKGKNATEATMYDTLKKLESDYGFTVEKMTPRSGNDIVWDSTTNRFALVAKDNKVIYTDPNRPTVDMTNKAQMWRITEAGESLTDGYAHYLTTGWAGEVKVTTGVDVGDNNDVDVTYKRTTENVTTLTPQTADVRTNGGTFTVNAPLDTINHHGEAESVNVVAVANNSYHENGTVKFVEISKGRMALETGAEVNHIHINAKVVNDVKQDVFDNIIIAKANDVTMPEFSRDDVEIATAGTLVVALQTGTEEVTSQTKLDYVWLTKQGVYEQITVSDSATKATTTVGTQEQNVWVNTSNKPAETKTAAQQIANNIGSTATVGSNTYDVAVDEETRDIVLKETGTDTVVYTVTVEEGKTVVTTTGDEPETVEVEVVEAQPDKEAVQIGATLFAGGSGTESDPYLISDSTQLLRIDEDEHEGRTYYKFINNIDLNASRWYVTILYDADIDLNNYTLNLTVADNAKYGFVELAVVQKYGCIHNGKITLIGESNIFYDYTNNSTIVIKNVDLSGSIEVAGKMGPHYGVLCSYLGNTTNNFSLLSEMYIENVNSWVNIKANSTCVGGLLGYCLNSKVSIKNVNVYSNIETGYGAGGIVMSDSQVTSNYIEASNILFHGNILVPEGKSAFYYGNKRPSSNTDNTYAGETATLVKGINIDNDIVVADNGEFKINANSVYTKYVIRYSFSVDFLDDHAGGYPRVIEKEFSNDANQVISTGIYKNKVKEGTFNSNTDTYVTDGSNGIFTRTGESGTYFYDGVGTYKLSKYGVTVTVYAYSGENLKAVGSYSYPKD